MGNTMQGALQHDAESLCKMQDTRCPRLACRMGIGCMQVYPK